MKKTGNQAVKRCFGVILAVAMLVGLLPVQVFGATDISNRFTCPNFLSYVRTEIGRPHPLPIYPSHVSDILLVDVYSSGITSLNGIQHFTSLEWLIAGDNQLTTINVSNNSALKVLNVWGNSLTTLNVSNNPVLTTLQASDNQLTSLNVSNNFYLETLCVSYNQLTMLNISSNPKLLWLRAWDNQLTTLNVSNNLALAVFDAPGNQLTNLDVSNNIALASFNASNNQLTSLNLGIHPALTSLDVRNNQLTSLDLSHTPSIERIWAYDNQLTSLDISNNPELVSLVIADNDLASLDVSNNPVLNVLIVENNIMSSPNNVMVWQNLFPAYDWNNLNRGFIFSPQRQCPNNSTTSNDPTTTNDISGYFTCPAFRQYLNENHGVPATGAIYPFHVRNITRIAAPNRGIVSLSGIQHFLRIENIVVQGNNLTEIDLSGLRRLRHLNASNNNLTTLNITGATALEALSISRNNISTLTGLETLANLRIFWAEENALTSLAFHPAAPLTRIDVRGNTPRLSRANMVGGTVPFLSRYTLSEFFRPHDRARLRFWGGLAY